jgi:beta-galactosidase
VNLDVDGSQRPELRIDGYIGDQRAVTRRFSADQTKDRLRAWADDLQLIADGSDATRLAFQAADEFGALRPFVGGTVTIEISGPGLIVGDNPFYLAESGGAGAVWVRTVAGNSGQVKAVVKHSWLGTQEVQIKVLPHRHRNAASSVRVLPS